MEHGNRVLFEALSIDLPTLRLVTGDIPTCETDHLDKASQPRQLSRLPLEKKGMVKRIIAHLEKE